MKRRGSDPASVLDQLPAHLRTPPRLPAGADMGVSVKHYQDWTRWYVELESWAHETGMPLELVEQAVGV